MDAGAFSTEPKTDAERMAMIEELNARLNAVQAKPPSRTYHQVRVWF